MAEELATSPYGPLLELIDVRPLFDEEGLASIRYNLSVSPGECVFIECRDTLQSAQFTDLCAGLISIGEGNIRCMGLEWQNLEEKRAQALRGRIGRIMSDAGWIDLYGTHMNVLWQQLHHTRKKLDDLVEEAVSLAIRFGLPGLPTQLPDRLSVLDRRRAEYVRAFIGNPSLLLLENPITTLSHDIYSTFLSELTKARERGCAVIWIAPERSVWSGYKHGSTQNFRLGDGGLIEMRGS